MDSSLRKRSLVSKSSSVLPVAPVNRADDLLVPAESCVTHQRSRIFQDGVSHRDLFESVLICRRSRRLQSESSNHGSDVRSWHFSDVPAAPTNVRFQG